MELMKEYLEKRIKTLTDIIAHSKDPKNREMAAMRRLEVKEALKVYKGETDEFIKLALTEKL